MAVWATLRHYRVLPDADDEYKALFIDSNLGRIRNRGMLTHLSLHTSHSLPKCPLLPSTTLHT